MTHFKVMKTNYSYKKFQNWTCYEKNTAAIHHFPFSNPMSEIRQALTRQYCCRTCTNGYCCWMSCDIVLIENVRKRHELQKHPKKGADF